MPKPLVHRTRDEVEIFGAAVGRFAEFVGRWRTFVAENRTAIAALPRNADGTLDGYATGPTVTELDQRIDALANDLAALAVEHEDTLALLWEASE